MSAIKGGGRAALSENSQELIADLLQRLRDDTNPLLPRIKPMKELSSEHDKKRERKRFVKKLVEYHTRDNLSRKLNCRKSDAAPTKATVSSDDGNSSRVASKSDIAGKVRIEIIEAIYPSKKKKEETKASSKKKKKAWKEGSRKTLVCNRSDMVDDLTSQFQSKLRMKKKPKRIFYVDGKTEIDLTSHLGGLKDGEVLYVTSHENEEDTTKANEIAETASDSNPDDVIDPLEAVKKAYTKRRGQGTDNVTWKTDKGPFPKLSEHFDKLGNLPDTRINLPAGACRKDILSSIDKSRVVIICGSTGCGKSTQIPQFLLEGMNAAGKDTNILVTQPRRVAAIALAERVSQERNSPVGSEVGYHVRLARKVSKQTKIVYCTIGILLRMLVTPLEGDIPLSSVSFLVIDEVHERDLNGDFSLAILKPLLKENKSLKVILMSATASAELFVNYFKSPDVNPKVICIPGRTFPVTTRFLEETEKYAGAKMKQPPTVPKDKSSNAVSLIGSTPPRLSPRATSRIDNDFICHLIKASIENLRKEGKLNESRSILVFLPGKGEIETLRNTLYNDETLKDKDTYKILPLHSSLRPSEQRLVFLPVPKVGQVKLVLATNVAETSITVPDLCVVIDTGLVKESRFNSSTRIKELVTVYTSMASATQRAGRAGRTCEGLCFRLYSEKFAQSELSAQTTPEILRAPLDELVLQVCLLDEKRKGTMAINGTSPIAFLENAPEPPPSRKIRDACEHLYETGAVTLVATDPEDKFRLTPLGYHLSHLPLDAKVGKVLIVGCILDCVEQSLTIASSLSCIRSIWLPHITGKKDSNAEAREKQRRLVQDGFGGESWKGGTVKGDLIGVVAAYNAWSAKPTGKQRRAFARENALDFNVLCEIHSLREQFRENLMGAGFLEEKHKDWEGSCDDALLTSCCLVAGLFPNVATLLRPNRALKISGKRLITKDGKACRVSSSSFQSERVRNASESGGDVYAVFHAKHRSLGAMSTSSRQQVEEIFLSEVNFVSKCSLILFAGQIEMIDNAIVLDGWLKFKAGDKGQRVGSILLYELRRELELFMLRYIARKSDQEEILKLEDDRHNMIFVVRTLLADE